MLFSLTIWACSPPPITEELSIDLRPRVEEVLSLPATGQLQRRFTSQLDARQDAWLASETGGRVESIVVSVGDKVVKGQPLMQLNSEQSKANKSLAESRLADAKAVVKDARTQQKRLASLGSQISDADLEKSDIALARAKAARKGAQAQVAIAVRQLSEQTMIAPFDGKIAAIRPDVGELLPPGQAAIRIIDDTDFIVRIGLVEDEVRLAKDSETTFTTTVANESIPLTLKNISSATDGGLSWPAELAIGKHPNLRTGLTLTVNGAFALPDAESKIPLSALNENNAVWIIGAENQLLANPVTPIVEQGEYIYVNGLKPDTKIVKQSTRSLKNGSLVVPLKVPLR